MGVLKIYESTPNFGMKIKTMPWWMRLKLFQWILFKYQEIRLNRIFKNAWKNL